MYNNVKQYNLICFHDIGLQLVTCVKQALKMFYTKK